MDKGDGPAHDYVPLKTGRLLIRALVREDLDDVADTLGPETSAGRVFEKRTRDEAERWLRNRIAEQEALGFSIWAVEDASGALVGVCGLIPGSPHPMLCYAIRRRFQGHGYGAEAARAVLERGATRFDWIIATISRTNHASRCVAEQAGMRPEGPAAGDTDMLSFVFP